MADVRCSSLASPFPNETLYSWLCRIGLLSHAGSDSQFLQSFMQYSGEQLTSIFPAYVKPLVDYSGSKTEQLLTQHTILPYFRPFIRAHVYDDVFKSLTRSKNCDGYSKFSLLANRIPEQQLLFYCPHCVANDLKKVGFAYWHRDHQLPWVNICYLHNNTLVGLARKRKVFVLPPQSLTGDELNSVEGSHNSSLLAEQSTRLLQINHEELVPERITSTYISALQHNGLATDSGNVRQAKWLGFLEGYWRGSLADSIYEALFRPKSICTFPVNLIYQPGAQHHPLKHLAVIIPLFGSIESFLDAYDNPEKDKPISLSPENNYSRVSASQTKVLNKKLRNGESLRQSAKAAKVSVGFAKSTAIQNGVEIERRAQRLFAAERKQILDMLKEGLKTQQIANVMECSVSAVEQILTQFPTVRKLREKLRYYQKRYRHRQAIVLHLRKRPSATRGEIQKQVRASYYWCYKHDKKWLYQNLPSEIPRNERCNRREHD